MWAHAGDVLPRIAAFLFGDQRCNASAARLVHAAVAYTAGFRKVTAAAAAAAGAGVAFSASEVRGQRGQAFA